VVTTSRRAAGFYRQAQRAVDARRATAALRLAVNADPAFGLAIADLDARLRVDAHSHSAVFMRRTLTADSRT
jgi:hypothetical protein